MNLNINSKSQDNSLKRQLVASVINWIFIFLGLLPIHLNNLRLTLISSLLFPLIILLTNLYILFEALVNKVFIIPALLQKKYTLEKKEEFLLMITVQGIMIAFGLLWSIRFFEYLNKFYNY